MKKNQIELQYKKKIKLLTEYNKNYFDKNNPIVDDNDYDKLRKEILLLEKNYKFLFSKNSPSKKIGYKPSKNFKKVSHRISMLSLANAFGREDLINFEKKIFNFLSKNKDFILSYSAEPKIDGISASLIYKNGEFKIGLSRGDGKEGEDITANLATINDIPKKIKSKDFPEEIDVRGEVYIQNSDFENLKEKFANPRNAASGSLRQKNPEDTKKIPLKFIAYTFGYEKGLKAKNQTDFLKNLDDWGFKTNPLNKLVTGVDNLLINYSKIEKDRAKIDFDIDGIVYKINDFELQKRLGNVANSPRWAIAHKFASNKAISKILNIEIQIGRTGALTPVAKIKPINIGGVVVSNATLHNEDEIDRKDIRIGDLATIERAGDVIPHILSVDKTKRDKKSLQFIFPKNCPSCGSKTIKEFNNVTKKEDAVRRCSSEGYDCEKIAIEKLKHFVSKEALNIEGFGKKIVENFWKLNLIKLPQDIFNLDFKKIENLEGWGKQSMENLRYSINQRKNISLERLIYSLGIRHIGLENAKILSKYFKSFYNFINFSNEINSDDILNIDGIGETQLQSVKNFFNNKVNLNILKDLQKILVVKNITTKNKNGLLNAKTFMVTGKLNGISRAEVKSLIEENSGSSVSTVSKKLDYLIIGDKPTKKKVDKAIEFKITILNQSQFLKLLNITS
ncbi:NAD-dependent DNA ligase LigA [Candidatus Pelagibacter bacterium nBUS_49]|uniref:NAD-dependent DNA ligase LigA n=1 Tax=Candidatus Pelagibacter bacterium nBUS_49 TaxID=3374196 RepID=UPI003EBA3357